MKARDKDAGNKRAGNLDGEVAELRRRLAAREAELAEALAQQTATAEILQIINSCAGDLMPVFDAILERSMRLCEAAYGHFVRYDGEFFHRVAVRGKPEVAEWQARHSPSPSRGEGTVTFQRLLQGETIVHVSDVKDTGAYRAGNPAARALVDIGGCRSLLTVGLRKDGTLLGLISLYREGVRPFSERQIGLLEDFAAQAVIAMDNARLITDTREALEQQTATAEVLGVINSSPGDLAPVFDAMLEKATDLCDVAFGHIWRFDGEFFHPAAARADAGVVQLFLQTKPYRPGPGSPTERLLKGEPFVQIADYQSDEVQPSSPQVRENIRAAGVRTGLLVGLRKDQVLLGAINVFRQEVRPFTDKQIALLQNFAAQAVIAMENVRLITETREALEQQTATAEVLGVINSSPGDLTPVFDAMLEKASRLCEAAFGGLTTYDGGRFHTLATRGLPPALEEVFREPFVPSPGSFHERVARGELLVHGDHLENPSLQSGSPQTRGAVELGGARTGLVIALRKDDHLVGSFWFYRQEARPLSSKKIALLQNFAAQAVIALET